LGFGHDGQQQAILEVAAIKRSGDGIVERIASSRRRQRLRFRLIFFGTWLILLGLAIGGMAAAGKIDPEFLNEWAPYILNGVGITITVAVASIVLATILAVLGALGRLSSNPVIFGISSFYVSLVRGTPLIVQIIFVYAALPQIWLGFAKVDAVILGIAALSFNYGAYMTEIFRAGIQAVPRGQVEAAGAIGMTDRLTMRRVILPQAVRIVTPAIGNEFIAMVKDSALVSLIGVQELLWRAQTVGSQKFRSLETLLLAALVYWILTIVLSLFQDRLEKRMAESDRRI
jgi:polar amino acid transport system permease protein